ncbi:MAG TPA: Hpt domain-containing protein [Pedococcus sp.]|jgi:chemotaxis protein histidine kinase CheA|nr:Hpt domain-containing protein [Pedococcus sp.]
MSTDHDPFEEVEAGALEPAMAAFRDRARATNLTRVEVIAEALGVMLEGALPEEERLKARGAAHSLAGSAGTFGFAEASELGRALEALLDDADGTEDPKARAARGSQLVAHLRVTLSDPAVAAPGSAAGDDSP